MSKWRRIFSLESSMDLCEWFLVFHLHNTGRGAQISSFPVPGKGIVPPELQEQHPARPQSSCRSWGGEFGISWEGGFRFQEILLSQSGLGGIWKDHLPKIPPEGNWIPFPHKKKTKPSYGRVKFSVSQWLQDITKSWGFSCWRLFLFFFKELEASVKSTGCS